MPCPRISACSFKAEATGPTIELLDRLDPARAKHESSRIARRRRVQRRAGFSFVVHARSRILIPCARAPASSRRSARASRCSRRWTRLRRVAPHLRRVGEHRHRMVEGIDDGSAADGPDERGCDRQAATYWRRPGNRRRRLLPPHRLPPRAPTRPPRPMATGCCAARRTIRTNPAHVRSRADGDDPGPAAPLRNWPSAGSRRPSRSISRPCCPPNITFPSMLRVAIDEKDPKPVDVAWTRCLPGGCFASLAMSDEVLTRWAQAEGGRISSRTEPARIDGRHFLPGLARALDALAEGSNPHQYASGLTGWQGTRRTPAFPTRRPRWRR